MAAHVSDHSSNNGPHVQLPDLSVTAANGEEVAKCTVKFQCGLLREEETFVGEDVEILCADSLLEYVCDMLAFKYPDHPYGDLFEKIILYRHDKASDELVHLSDNDVITDGTLIEIVLAAEAKQVYSESICPHILSVHTYKTPTFCNHCGVVMFGIMKQGLKCEGCDKNFHKGCAYKIPNDCTRHWGDTATATPSRNSTGRGSTSRSSITLPHGSGASSNRSTRDRKETWSGRPLWIDKALHSRQQVPHTFYVQSFKKPTACHHCKKLIRGVFRNGMKCKDCQFCCHKKCVKEVGSNCPGEVPSLSQINNGEWTHKRNIITNEYTSDEVVFTMETKETEVKETDEGRLDDSPTSSVSSQEQLESGAAAPGMDPIAEEPSGGEDTVSNDGSEHNQAENVPSGNIMLQRVTGVSMRHTKAPSATVLMEGWMVHYTNKSTLRKKHYWRLDTKSLTFYKDQDSASYYKEIQLADIMAVDPMVNHALYPLSPPHVFEIVTSNCTYYVGVDMTGAVAEDLTPPSDVEVFGVNVLTNVGHMTLIQLEEIGVGLNIALNWEEALHSALMPVTPQASMGSLADIGVPGATPVRPPSFRSKRGSLRGSFRGSRGNSFRGSMRNRHGSMRGSFRAVKQNVPPSIPARVAMKPKIETRMDVSQVYQIFPQEILGSGQFGTVFGGQNRTTGKTVAVKVIDKLRFPHKQDTALRQEVTILQFLDHPGIICLEQMFETPEKIYIAMEKMNGDMLEMILSSPNSKLSERVTKFLVYQILAALQYLHKKDIVHCDLKPENVLLTSEKGMPQAKLCDFGFARIIGDKSFRKSIVGTPAYLAPEVLKNEGYNRSLDLWSVGVIIYVSLSGTFPFNEDEEISDQIQNAAFMYPPDPWATISPEAIDLVGKLLQINRRSRFKTAQALHHIWLRDLQLWEDLCELEGRLDIRYLTHESEDAWWAKQGAKTHPLIVKKEQKYGHHVYKNIVILDEPRPGAPSIATTAAIAKIPPPPHLQDSTRSQTTPTNGKGGSKEERSNGEIKTGAGTGEKANLEVSLSRLEEHALRVGYTVSTV